MARLVFDIETTALPIDHFDEAQQEYLFREAGRVPEGEPREIETRRNSKSIQPLALHCASHVHRHVER